LYSDISINNYVSDYDANSDDRDDDDDGDVLLMMIISSGILDTSEGLSA
jgi:hypothetical protein